MMHLQAQGLQRNASALEIAIVGDGVRSMAIASLLALSGQSVRLWTPDGQVPAECEIRDREARVGHTRGKTTFAMTSSDMVSAVKGASLLLLSTPAAEYGGVIDKLMPALSPGQTVVLANAPLGASLEFADALGMTGTGLKLNVLEMGSLFDWVKIEADVILVSGSRKRVSVCGLSRNETHRGLAVAGTLWNGLVPASNVLERGFSEAERILRPILRLFRILGSKSAGARPLSDSLSGAVLSVVEAVWLESQAIAREFGLVVPPMQQFLRDYCGTEGATLPECVEAVGHSFLQEELNQTVEQCLEKLAREICETFTLLSAFALLVRLPVPKIDAVIELASTVTGRDLRREGRSLASLGLVGYDAGEIVEMINA